MKCLIIAVLVAVAVADPQSYLLRYTSDEANSNEFGVKAGSASTNCSCGWTNKKRIVGGRTSLKNEFPLIAGLAARGSRKVYCGASILTTRHALTAAHCTEPMKNRRTQLIAGAHDLTANNDPNRVIVDIAYTIEHENYDTETIVNDIALVVLASPLKFTQYIGPVCLPTAQVNYEKEWLKVLGWGLTTHEGSTSDVLLNVNLKVLPLSTCSIMYRRGISTTRPSQICTYRDSKDSCQGDSGGPLVWLDPATNRYTQVALVSYGKACASRSPAVNTDVGYHLRWIHSKIALTRLGGSTCSKV